MSELKRCPFCGGSAEFVNSIGHDYYRNSAKITCTVRCRDCGVETAGCIAEDTSFTYKELAAEAWNRRVGDD